MWSLVFLGGIYLVLNRRTPGEPAAIGGPESPSTKSISWNYLPDIEPFELTDSSGKKFDTRQLIGRPYVVSFFYSTCPTICRQLNEQVRRLTQQFRKDDLTFLSITVDPETDTPARLQQYSEVYGPDPQRWHFLTGSLSEIQQIGEQQFRVVVDKAIHTEDILLIDRWGRYRDRFKWDDPSEMRRFDSVAQTVLDETSPPLGKVIETRNLLAGNPHVLGNNPPWLHEFFLTKSDGTQFFSRDLTGQVWIGSVFYSTCTTHCIEQNRYLRDLQDRLADKPVKFVSITTDPQTDTPSVLQQYARELKADPQRWIFLTGKDKTYLDRVASEFLGLFVSGADHASLLVVIDRWGKVRGKFDWHEATQEAAMLKLIDELIAEDRPPKETADHSSRSAEVDADD